MHFLNFICDLITMHFQISEGDTFIEMVSIFACMEEYNQNYDWNGTFRSAFAAFVTENITTEFVKDHDLYKALAKHNAQCSSDALKRLAGQVQAKFIYDNMVLASIKKEARATRKKRFTD